MGRPLQGEEAPGDEVLAFSARRPWPPRNPAQSITGTVETAAASLPAARKGQRVHSASSKEGLA